MKNSSRSKSRIILPILTIVVLGAIFYAAIIRNRIDFILAFSVLTIACMIGWAIARIKVM